MRIIILCISELIYRLNGHATIRKVEDTEEEDNAFEVACIMSKSNMEITFIHGLVPIGPVKTTRDPREKENAQSDLVSRDLAKFTRSVANCSNVLGLQFPHIWAI